MKYLIPANHVKCFARSIHCLSRLGSEIYFDCTEIDVQLKTLNASRSTFASFVFPSVFFEEFEPVIEDEEENQFLRCKISVKTFLQVFRSIAFIERSVETCEIKLSDNLSQLIFTLNCKHAVVKTYQLNFEECESLKAVYTKDLSPNKLTASSKLLQDVFANFPTSLDEITLSVTPCKVSLSSFADEDEVGKIMSTEMNLSPKEFSYFQIGIDSCVSFCLKDIRSILTFAESCGSECKMNFEYGGKPFVLELSQEEIFTANFVLATISGDLESQQPSTSVLTETTNNNHWSERTNANESRIQPTKTVSKKASKISAHGRVNNHEEVEHEITNNISNHQQSFLLGKDDTIVHVNAIFFSGSGKNQVTAVDNTVLAADSDDES
ncbi:cell cycle checkpoint control protein RAD9A-like [Styela clava]